MTTERYSESSNEEFMNMREIINDLLHRLHEKDRSLINRVTFVQLYHEQFEFRQFIRCFYKLNHPKNPLVTQDRYAEDVLDDILLAVYNHINGVAYSSPNPPTTIT